MRNVFLVLLLSLSMAGSALAQLAFGVAAPGISIGINLSAYPQLVPVPGYPVYYAPQVNSNYFFYDGMYWVFQGDNWYASTWYNGPWELVPPTAVPLFVLRVPVRYYRQPPVYFHGWSSNAPPRWGDHWGYAWEQQRRGWDHWNRSAVPPPAPLPNYQRQYAGARYPHVEQQQVLQNQNYGYRPHDAAVQQHYRAPETQTARAASGPGTPAAPQQRTSPRQDPRISSGAIPPDHAAAPRGQPQPRANADAQRPAAKPPAPQRDATMAPHPPQARQAQQQAPRGQTPPEPQRQARPQQPQHDNGQRQGRQQVASDQEHVPPGQERKESRGNDHGK